MVVYISVADRRYFKDEITLRKYDFDLTDRNKVYRRTGREPVDEAVWLNALCAEGAECSAVRLIVYALMQPTRGKGGSSGGHDWGDRPLKPTKVTSCTLIFYNLENGIRDMRPLCSPLFCHSSVVKYISSLLQ